MPHVTVEPGTADNPVYKVGGKAFAFVALEGGTVGELLRELEREHPAVGGWILDERGALRRHINVYVDGRPGDLGTALDGRSHVEVIAAISGG